MLDLIHLLEYEGVIPAARILGILQAEAIVKLDLAQKPTLLVPVPLHLSKRPQHGFSRSEMIAQAPLKKFGSANLQLLPVLIGKRATGPQVGLTPPQPFANIGDRFRVAHPSRAEGRAILLVHDVRVLRKERAKNVPVARTLKESTAIRQVEPEFEEAALAS